MTKRTRSQSGALSRRKGASFERSVVKALQAAGIACRRNTGQAGSAKVQGCDIEDTSWWIECGHGKAMDPRAKYEQAERDQERTATVDGEWRPIVVVWKRDGMREVLVTLQVCALLDALGEGAVGNRMDGTLITMSLADWCELAKEGA